MISSPGRRTRLPRLLFVLAMASAALLFITVAVAPAVEEMDLVPASGQAVVQAFAADTVIRQTAVATGLGLMVTAFVFFRPPVASRPSRPAAARSPRDVVGA